MGRFAVWVSELDSRLSRKYGRLVPRNVAVKKPSAREVEDAALSLGFRVVEMEASRLNPRLAGLDEDYRVRGYLVIEAPHGKTKALKMIAEKIRELRKRTEGRKSKSKKRRR